MVADFTFGTYAVYDPIADVVLENAAGGHLVLVKGGTAQSIYDLDGSPITEIVANGSGQTQLFRADVGHGLLQFGDLVVTVWANEIAAYAIAAQTAVASAQSAADSAAAAAVSAQAAYEAMQDLVSSGGGLTIAQLDAHLGGDTTNLLKRIWGVREPTGVGTYAAIDTDFDHLLSYGSGADPANVRGDAITDAQFDIHERVEP